ncbi:homeobox-leucine zipper protein HAT14-like [Rutidosis leptorrhynchoides]|uniref:homeobox-leucine zipper protein HAT14-like n=1 Tax=Rutidosis leptorrhynchoides TaxID=125765 RepID=UPI003A99BCA0
MELALSLGDSPKPNSSTNQNSSQPQKMEELGFCMGLGSNNSQIHDHKPKIFREKNDPPPRQLDLLPFSPPVRQSPPPPPPHHPFPWLSRILIGEASSVGKLGIGLDVKPLNVYDPENCEEPATVHSSPNDSNSDSSSFHMDFSSIFKNSKLSLKKRNFDSPSGNMDYLMEVSERDRRVPSTRGRYGGTSDEDENGLAGRKKLRLTKEQSVFLEDSFKEHNTLNPKQKLILADQLNLRPRQIEVWFQNRRARTKLKQTEVDCEYLKTCCESLTEENRRLQKELQELRALKTSQPFYMQHPATTLNMCPSCERVVTTTTPASTSTAVSEQPSS